MKKTKLLKRQKPTVKAWCDKHNGKVVQVRDRSCRYRECIIDWDKEVFYPHLNKRAIVNYRTSLELTPTGKIRREIHQQQQVRYIETEEISDGTQLVLPLGEVVNQLPKPPKNIIRNYLFPRDRSKARTTKKYKSKQQTLPIDGVAAQLNQIGLSKGRNPESVETLLAGKVDHYSLEQNKVIPLPVAFVEMLNQLQCSSEEWEFIVNMYQVVSPDAVLRLIEEIPVMRDIPQFKTFVHPRPKVTQTSNVISKQPQLIAA